MFERARGDIMVGRGAPARQCRTLLKMACPSAGPRSERVQTFGILPPLSGWRLSEAPGTGKPLPKSACRIRARAPGKPARPCLAPLCGKPGNLSRPWKTEHPMRITEIRTAVGRCSEPDPERLRRFLEKMTAKRRRRGQRWVRDGRPLRGLVRLQLERAVRRLGTSHPAFHAAPLRPRPRKPARRDRRN